MMKNLYGDVAAVTKIFGEINCSHAATANFANYPISLLERVREPVQHLLLVLSVVGLQTYGTALFRAS